MLYCDAYFVNFILSYWLSGNVCCFFLACRYYVILTYRVSKSLRVPFTLVILVCYSLPSSLQL